MQRCAAVTRLARRGSTTPCKRGVASEAPPPHQPGFNPEEPPPPPPNMFAAVGAMGAGALGAVFIAAVGVWGVFKMAFYVASETGRTINADKPTAGSSGGSGSSAEAQQPAAPAPSDVKAASPLEPRQLGAPPSFASAAAWSGSMHSGILSSSWARWKA